LELQFLEEGKNAEKVAKRFTKYPWLKIPKIYWKLSSNRVLAMEYCDGGQINDHDYMVKNNISTELISERLGLLYSDMIFLEGYVHCDPHPGNILVETSNKGPRIVLLDHGLYTHLSETFRSQYCELWLALLSANVERIKKSAEALGVGHMYGLLSAMVTARSWKSITHGIQREKMTDKEAKDIRANAAKFFPQITEVLERIPREMVLVLKTNDLLRGIESSLKRKPGTSFVPMTRLCMTAAYKREMRLATSTFQKAQLKFGFMWSQIRVNLYVFFLRIWNFLGILT